MYGNTGTWNGADSRYSHPGGMDAQYPVGSLLSDIIWIAGTWCVTLGDLGTCPAETRQVEGGGAGRSMGGRRHRPRPAGRTSPPQSFHWLRLSHCEMTRRAATPGKGGPELWVSCAPGKNKRRDSGGQNTERFKLIWIVFMPYSLLKYKFSVKDPLSA